MPTISEIKAEMKDLGIKGITGKKKGELMAMLEAYKTKPAPTTATYAGQVIQLKKKRKARQPVVETPQQAPLPAEPVPPRGKFKSLTTVLDPKRVYYKSTTSEDRVADMLRYEEFEALKRAGKVGFI